MENNKTECEESKQDELTQKWIGKLTPDQIIKIMSDQYKFTRKLVEKITSGNSTYDQDISDKLERAESLLQHIAGTLDRISKYQLEKTLDEWKQLKPFLIAELEKPIYKSLDIERLENGDIPESGNHEMFELLEKALDAAIAEMKAQEKKLELLSTSNLARKTITSIKRPTDRLNRTVAFNTFLLENNGQMYFADVRTGKINNPQTVYYCLKYNDANTKPIGYVAKHLLEVAYSTAQAQGGFVAWQDIYINLGKSGKLKQAEKDKFKDIFDTMRKTYVVINNVIKMTEEKCDYTHIEIDEQFFSSKFVKVTRKGQTTEGIYIDTNYIPPLFRFAKENGNQIAAVPIGVYQVPGLQLTEDNAILHDYLISIVAAMIKERIQNKITYNTIFNAIHMNGQSEQARKYRTRAMKKITRIFDTFKKCNWISNYKNTLSASSDY